MYTYMMFFVTEYFSVNIGYFTLRNKVELFCLLLGNSKYAFHISYSTWTNKYVLLYDETPPNLPGCRWWERSYFCLQTVWSQLPTAIIWLLPISLSILRK